MKRQFSVVAVLALTLTVVFTINAMADDSEVNIPITANHAFDAVVQQVDPITGQTASVALIDVRTTAEYFWVGACGKVESITTTYGREYFPIDGKVEFTGNDYLSFRVESYGRWPRWRRPHRVRLPLRVVESIETVDISIHIPTHIWDEAGCTKYANPDFASQIEALSADYDVLILMCRSGKRSDTRAFDTSLFTAIYEIDQPNGNTGYGGFQGSSYGDVFNGYRGYPGRNTWRQNSPAVSWSDAGLPVHIGWTPFAPDVPEPEPEEPEPEPELE